MIALSPAFAGWSLFLPSPWGSAARATPGFMLSPAPQAVGKSISL